MEYHCTTCPAEFDNFPAANNHEKQSDYGHLVIRVEEFHLTLVEELVACALPTCKRVVHAGDAKWDDCDNAFCSSNHRAIFAHDQAIERFLEGE